MMTNKYPFNIAWSEEDGEYVATCPSFPGLSAYGATEEDALKEGKVALGLFIESCQANGIPLPEPQVVQDYSGQFRVRIPKSLHAKAARMAQQDETSLNQLVLDAIAEKVGAKEARADDIKELKRAIYDLIVQHQITAQSINWPESKVADEIEIKQVVSTQIKRTRTASNKGTSEGGN